MVKSNSPFWACSRPLATFGSLCLLGGAIALAPISAAEAFTINDNGSIDVFRTALGNPEAKSDIGRWFDIRVGGNIEGQDYDGLSSLLRFNVSEFNVGGGTSTVVLNAEGYVGMFDDNAHRFEDYQVSVFGFQIDPDFSSAGVSGLLNNGGISKGEMGTFQIALNFDEEIDSFNLSNFGVEYQNVNSQYYALNGASGTGTGQAIPEPLTIIGTGAALAFGALFQKKRQQQGV